jgi:major type 1 subunit fimbrin (pilin)
MNVRKIAFASAALVASHLAQASDGTITFTGALQSATCTITGGGNQTVALPTLSTSSLSSTGSTAGDTSFSISVTGCTAGLTTASAYFESGINVNATTGRLKNGGAAGNVELQLLNGSGTTINLAGVTTAAQGATAANLNSSAGAQTFIARYYATGATTPGSVSSSVTYSLVYN